MWKSAIRTWFNERTDYIVILSKYKQRVLPDGPQWAYTTAAACLGLLLVEIVTGLLLMSCYSPSTTTAWGSVFYIEQLPGGRFLRGLHYFASQALIILLVIHTVRVLLHSAYRSPREMIWVFGIMLAPLVVALAVTGNPLSGSQKAFKQIEVEGNIVGTTPVVGPTAQRVLIGDDEVGNVALTHLNFLHVALLPLFVGLLTTLHIHQIIRHASFKGEEGVPEDALTYWPHQSARNWIVFGLVFGIVVFLSLSFGAPLEAPLNPPLSPGVHEYPRPEWYFLFLFELRHYFSGNTEFIATMVIPTCALILLLFIPAIDWFFSERTSNIFQYVIVLGGLFAWVGLTFTSVMRDLADEKLQTSLQHMEQLAERAQVLAERGIPPEGASAMLLNDPKTHGPVLFQKYCASCHPHVNREGVGITVENPSAPNLYQFASRNWIAGLLDVEQVSDVHYFGNTAFKEGSMADGVVDSFDEKQVNQIVQALSAEAKLKSQLKSDLSQASDIAAGIKLIKNEDEGCVQCHKFHDVGELEMAPDLTNYGSREWMIEFIRDPAHLKFYGYENDDAQPANDRMPRFATKPGDDPQNLLDQKSIELITDWLRGEWYEPTHE